MYRTLLMVLLLVSPPSPAMDGPSCSEEAFLEGVRANHPAAEVLLGRLDAAASNRLTAKLLANPRLEFNLEDPDGTAGVNEWLLSWSLPVDGRKGPAIDAAEAELTAASAALVSDRLGLRIATREVFADWYAVRARLDLFTWRADLLRELAESAAARATAGEIPGIESRRIVLESVQADADRARGESELESLLALVLFWRPDLGRSTRPERPELPPHPLVNGVEGHPDLEALRAEVRKAEFTERLAGRVLEAPVVSIGWQRIKDGPNEFDGPLFSLDWAIPLFDRKQGERQAAEARVRTTRAELRLRERRAATALNAAVAAYEGLRLEAVRAARAVVGSPELLHAAREAYRAGEIGLTDLLDTIRAVEASNLAALELHLDALAAHRDLEAAAGRALTRGENK